jgi:hypothetical protein
MRTETLESRMMGNYQVRFGGGRLEKEPQGYLASRLPYFVPLEHSVICRLTIRLPDGMVLTKSDAGGYAGMADPGDDDKSGFADAFKRAAVKFGVGRYLYRDGIPKFARAGHAELVAEPARRRRRAESAPQRPGPLRLDQGPG